MVGIHEVSACKGKQYWIAQYWKIEILEIGSNKGIFSPACEAKKLLRAVAGTLATQANGALRD